MCCVVIDLYWLIYKECALSQKYPSSRGSCVVGDDYSFCVNVYFTLDSADSSSQFTTIVTECCRSIKFDLTVEGINGVFVITGPVNVKFDC